MARREAGWAGKRKGWLEEMLTRLVRLPRRGWLEERLVTREAG